MRKDSVTISKWSSSITWTWGRRWWWRHQPPPDHHQEEHEEADDYSLIWLSDDSSDGRDDDDHTLTHHRPRHDANKKGLKNRLKWNEIKGGSFLLPSVISWWSWCWRYWYYYEWERSDLSEWIQWKKKGSWWRWCWWWCWWSLVSEWDEWMA